MTALARLTHLAVAAALLAALPGGAVTAAEPDQPPAAAPFATQLRSSSVLLGTNARFASRFAFDFSQNLVAFSNPQGVADPGLVEIVGAPPRGLTGTEGIVDNNSADPIPIPALAAPAVHPPALGRHGLQSAGGAVGCPHPVYRANAETPYWAVLATETHYWSGAAANRPNSARPGGPDDAGPDEVSVTPVTEAFAELQAHLHPSEWCPPGTPIPATTTPFSALLWGPVALFIIGAATFYAVRGLRRP